MAHVVVCRTASLRRGLLLIMTLRTLYHPLFIVALGLPALVVLDTTWLMPGPLSRFHAKLEHRCTHCHVPFTSPPNEKCLACKSTMKLVQDHGIHRYARLKRCAACHVEHRTRAYPLASAWVNPITFDHRWTGFDLGCFHRKLACTKCHPDPRTYRGAKRTCAGCHKDFCPGIWDHRKTGCDLDALHTGLPCDRCHQHKWGPGLHPTCTRCHPHKNYDPNTLCRKGTASLTKHGTQ